MVLKFKDKCDVIMFSTKHDSGLSQNSKPFVIEDYNKGKLFVDTSDQMCSYSPFVRKTTKWYIRLLFHIITQTMVVNSCVLYRKIFDEIPLSMFKRQIVVIYRIQFAHLYLKQDIILKKLDPITSGESVVSAAIKAHQRRRFKYNY